MARRSPHEKRKPDIYKLFDAGLKVASVRVKYPEISKSTIYDWHKEWKALRISGNQHASVDNSGNGEKPDSPKVVDVEVLEPESSPKPSGGPPVELTVIEGNFPQDDSNLSDYWRTRKEMVAIANSQKTKPSVKVQAAAVLCKMLDLQKDLPTHILEETTEFRLDDERERLSDQSDADIARHYREALG